MSTNVKDNLNIDEDRQVEEWNHYTVADGEWLNDHDILPLSARDEYLAEEIDKIATRLDGLGGGTGIVVTAGANAGDVNRIEIAPVVDADNATTNLVKHDVKTEAGTITEYVFGALPTNDGVLGFNKNGYFQPITVQTDGTSITGDGSDISKLGVGVSGSYLKRSLQNGSTNANDRTFAIGNAVNADDHFIAFGENLTTKFVSDTRPHIIEGHDSTVQDAMFFGANSYVSGGIHVGATITATNGVSFGTSNVISGPSITIGTYNYVTGGLAFGSHNCISNGIAFGTCNNITGVATVFGASNKSSNNSSVIFGDGNDSNGGVAFGTSNHINNGVIFGAYCSANGGVNFGSYNTLTGGLAFGTYVSGAGLGYGSFISAVAGAHAFGIYLSAKGGGDIVGRYGYVDTNSRAFGSSITAHTNSLTVGTNVSSIDNSVGMGNNVTAADCSVVVGNNTYGQHKDVLIGCNLTPNRQNPSLEIAMIGHGPTDGKQLPYLDDKCTTTFALVHGDKFTMKSGIKGGDQSFVSAYTYLGTISSPIPLKDSAGNITAWDTSYTRTSNLCGEIEDIWDALRYANIPRAPVVENKNFYLRACNEHIWWQEGSLPPMPSQAGYYRMYYNATTSEVQWVPDTGTNYGNHNRTIKQDGVSNLSIDNSSLQNNYYSLLNLLTTFFAEKASNQYGGKSLGSILDGVKKLKTGWGQTQYNLS